MSAQSDQETFSRFGGLWIDRKEAIIVLNQKRQQGILSRELSARIETFMRDGFVVIESAVPKEQTEFLRSELNKFWADSPEDARVENWTAEGKQQFVRPEISLRDGTTKLLDYHAFSSTARKAIATAPVVEFLTAIFESKPKAFQSLTFWKGSEQAIHKDTAYVQIDGAPMEIAASWLALEDISPGTGELEYYVGSHHDPDFLFAGEHKWMSAAPHEHDRFLKSLHEDAVNYDHQKASFLANEGDVLIWHADLAHGGAKITRPGTTRQSLVTHFTPENNNPPYMQRVSREPVEEAGCIFLSQFRQI